MHRHFKKEALEAIDIAAQAIDFGSLITERAAINSIVGELDLHWNLRIPSDRIAEKAVRAAHTLGQLREAVELIQPPKLG